MAETLLLKTSAIVRNASVGPSTPPPVSSGALQLVQVKMGPGGPQVQGRQKQRVEVLPPRDAQSAAVTGGLPLVQVKMTSTGPKLEDGMDRPVVILPAKDSSGNPVAAGGLPMVQVRMSQGGPQVQTPPMVLPPRDASEKPVAAGHLPVVEVKMTPGGPQVQTVSQVQGAPPQIQATPTAVSQPRVVRVPAPSTSKQLTADQLLLCRHLVDKYLDEQRANALPDAEPTPEITLAETAIATLDQIMIEQAAKASRVPPTLASTQPIAVTQGPVVRPRVMSAGARPQSMGPRRVARPPAPIAAPITPTVVEVPVIEPTPEASAETTQSPD